MDPTSQKNVIKNQRIPPQTNFALRDKQTPELRTHLDFSSPTRSSHRKAEVAAVQNLNQPTSVIAKLRDL